MSAGPPRMCITTAGAPRAATGRRLPPSCLSPDTAVADDARAGGRPGGRPTRRPVRWGGEPPRLFARGARVLADARDERLALRDAALLHDGLARAVHDLDLRRQEVRRLADALVLAVRENVLV